jgi:hypothetical protein
VEGGEEVRPDGLQALLGRPPCRPVCGSGRAGPVGRELADDHQLAPVDADEGGAPGAPEVAADSLGEAAGAGGGRGRRRGGGDEVDPGVAVRAVLEGEGEDGEGALRGQAGLGGAAPGGLDVGGVQQLVHQVALDALLGRLDGVFLGQLDGQDGGRAAGGQLVELRQIARRGVRLGQALAEGDEAPHPLPGHHGGGVAHHPPPGGRQEGRHRGHGAHRLASQGLPQAPPLAGRGEPRPVQGGELDPRRGGAGPEVEAGVLEGDDPPGGQGRLADDGLEAPVLHRHLGQAPVEVAGQGLQLVVAP